MRIRVPREIPRWLTWLYVVSCVFILITGIGFYRAEERSVYAAATTQLDAISQLKVGQISLWRAQQLNAAADLMSARMLIRVIDNWLSRGRGDERGLILARLEELHRRLGLAAVQLVDAGGAVRLDIAGTGGAAAAELRAAVERALRERRPVLSDFYALPSEEAGSPRLAAVAPLVSAAGRVLGAAILEIDARHSLQPIVRSWPTASPSAETLLLRRDGDTVLFLSDVRHRPDTALKQRVPLADTGAVAAMAALGRAGIVSGRDYRGVPALAVLRSIPDSAWHLVTEIDEAEVMADWHLRGALILGVLLGAIAMLLGSLLWLRRAIADRNALQAAQDALADRAEEYRALFDNAPVGKFLATADGTLLRANPALAHMLGERDDTALIDQAVGDGESPLAPRVLGDVVAACTVDSPAGGRRELTLQRRDGEPVWVDVAVHATTDHGGRVRYHGVVQDVSERRRVADLVARYHGELEDLVAQRTEELRISEEHRAIALAAAGAGSWDWDLHENRITWEAFDGLLGYQPGEVEPSYEVWAARVHPDDLRATEEKVRTAIDRGTPSYAAEYRVIWPDGSEHWIDARGRLATDPEGHLHLFGVAVDITERKQQEAVLEARVRARTQELQQERDFVDTVLGVAPVLVVVLDREGRIVRFNRACEQLSGFGSDDVMGKAWHTMMAAEGGAQVWADFLAQADDCCPARFEATWHGRDGAAHLIEWHNTCLTDADGRVSLLVGAGIEITERRRMEKEVRQRLEDLAQMHRLHTMGELAALLAHQLNQPLGAARSFAEAGLIRLRGQAVDAEQVSRTLQRVVEQTERAAQVIRDLRRFLAKQSPEPTLYDLNTAASTACQLMRPLARGRRVDIRLDLAESLPPTLMRPTQIEQVLINLLHNAVEAIDSVGDAMGIVWVGTGRSPDGGSLLVSVRDSGPGLDAVAVRQVFEPLYTTKTGGIGMGLSISRSIIADHGGRIWATAGKGGDFRIELPVTP
ncbi:MAG: PAS domain S-box protein [Sterolibacteriaceae bacterium MAG5]|nr:PAS domain S-box protein [Candidatus Nitricoxidireducens bremensis]